MPTTTRIQAFSLLRMAGKSKKLTIYFAQVTDKSTAIIAAWGGEKLEPDAIPVDSRIALSKASAIMKAKKTERL